MFYFADQSRYRLGEIRDHAQEQAEGGGARIGSLCVKPETLQKATVTK